MHSQRQVHDEKKSFRNRTDRAVSARARQGKARDTCCLQSIEEFMGGDCPRAAVQNGGYRAHSIPGDNSCPSRSLSKTCRNQSSITVTKYYLQYVKWCNKQGMDVAQALVAQVCCVLHMHSKTRTLPEPWQAVTSHRPLPAGTGAQFGQKMSISQKDDSQCHVQNITYLSPPLPLPKIIAMIS